MSYIRKYLSKLISLEDDKQDTPPDDSKEESKKDEAAEKPDTEDKDDDKSDEEKDEETDEKDESTTDSETPSETDGTSGEEDKSEVKEEKEEEEEEDDKKEEEPPRRPSVKLDDPEEEKGKIYQYLEPLLGEETTKELKLFSANEINRPLYHVSMNTNIKAFTPKVSKRTVKGEDRTVARISTSPSLVGCLNGYQSILDDMLKRKEKNFEGLYRVYELPYQYAIKPSKKLLQDVDISDEYWLVSWKKETWSTVPNTAADFTIPKIENVFGSDGIDKTVVFYIRAYKELYITNDLKLKPGYHRVIFKGYSYKYPLENNKLIDVEEMDENEYNKITSMSIMIKKKAR